MIAKTATTTHLAQMLAQARAATDALFGMVRPGALHDRPVPERHRTIFYFGHLEAFDWNLVSQAAGVPSFHPEFDQLFAFGIDPEPGKSPQDKRSLTFMSSSRSPQLQIPSAKAPIYNLRRPSSALPAKKGRSVTRS